MDDSLRVDRDPGGHVVLTWDAPPVDAGPDALAEVGSATSTTWFGVDGQSAPETWYYRVGAENSGGTE